MARMHAGSRDEGERPEERGVKRDWWPAGMTGQDMVVRVNGEW